MLSLSARRPVPAPPPPRVTLQPPATTVSARRPLAASPSPLTLPAPQPAKRPNCLGISLLEVVIAMALLLGGALAAVPALALSLKILTADQKVLDQEIALEAAWKEISSNPAQFFATGQQEFRVGGKRYVPVKIEALEPQNGLRRWKLSVSDPTYSEERWLSK